MDTIKLEAQPREILGKKVKNLRRQGLVPANVYGRHLESTPVQLSERAVALQLLRASASSLVSLEVDGSPRTVLVKKLQRHPTSGRVLHVDFYQVAMTEKLRASVPLHFVGEAPAVKQSGGTLLHSVSSVEVESLPADLPAGIEVDVSKLETTADAITVGDLSLPEGVTILSDPAGVVATVVPPAVAPVEVEAAEEAAAPAEAGAEAEQPAEAAAEEPAEA